MTLRKLWTSWAILTSFFFGMYFFRVAPSAISEYLMPYFNISLPEIGFLTSCFFITYTISQVPVGYALGRFSVKNLMIGALFVCSVAIQLFIAAPNFYSACLATILYAAFASFAFVGAISYASAKFPSHLLPLAVSLTQTAGMLGGFVGKNVVISLTLNYGWTTALSFVSVVLIFISLMITFFVPATPVIKSNETLDNKTPNEANSEEPSLYGQSKTWFTAFYAGLVFLPMYSFAESIGEPMLSTIHSLDLKNTAFAISMAYVGWIVGGPIAGIASDIYGRIKVMQFSALCGVIFAGLTITLPMPYWALCTCLFLYGLTNTGLSACYTVASEMYSQKQSSLSVAISNMFTNVFGAILIPILSSTVDKFFTPVIINGVPKYSPEAYQYVFIVLVIAPLLAYFCTFMIPETMKKPAS